MTDPTNRPRSEIRHRITLIACYFGPLPPYVPIVFRAMEANSAIDWLLIVDQIPSCSLPTNIRIKILSMAELSDLSSEAVGTKIRIAIPYQVCSLRPAFGLIFREMIRNSDFWGHVDLDAIYGDFQSLIPADAFLNFDRILCRGHLSMYRNTESVAHAFKLDAPGALNYKNVFSDLTVNTAFDEWRGIWKIMRYHNFKQYHSECIADIVPPDQYKIRRFESFGEENHPYQFFYWHEGRTFHAYYHREGGLFDNEVAYIHFQKRNLPAPTFEINESRGFTVGPSGFKPYNRENLSPGEIMKLNSDQMRPLRVIAAHKIAGIRKRFF